MRVGTEGRSGGLEALCRSVENPPEACFDTVSALTKADAHTNGPIARPGSTVVVVIVSDEGDGSRRLAEGEADPAPYLDLFAGFDNPKFAVIGPDYDAKNTSSSATTRARPSGRSSVCRRSRPPPAGSTIRSACSRPVPRT
jgi:hypothetical protein